MDTEIYGRSSEDIDRFLFQTDEFTRVSSQLDPYDTPWDHSLPRFVVGSNILQWTRSLQRIHMRIFLFICT